MEESTLLEWKDIVKLVGMTEKTIRKEIKAGRFPKPFHISKRFVRWTKSDIDKWVVESRQRSSDN